MLHVVILPNVLVRNDLHEAVDTYIEVGTALTDALARVPPEDTQLLRWVAPYTDTVFNVGQIDTVIEELEIVLSGCRSQAESEAVESVLRLAHAVGVHQYLVFVGD